MQMEAGPAKRKKSSKTSLKSECPHSHEKETPKKWTPEGKGKPAYGCCGKTDYKLFHWTELPEYLRHNSFIQDAYRVDITLVQALKGIFHIHNETCNVWTHLLGFFFFLGVLIVGLNTWLADAQFLDRAVFIIYCVAALVLMTCSTTFHLIGCCGEETYNFTAKLDYTGIAVQIVGSYFGPLWYILGESHPWWCIFYISIVVVLGMLSVYSVWSVAMHEPGSEWLRLAVFLALGCAGALPLPHILHLVGLEVGWPIVKRLMVMAVFYGLGSFVYASKFPECTWPGKFDIWFQSHTIWHLLVLGGAISHWHNIEYAFWLRRCILDEGSAAHVGKVVLNICLWGGEDWL